MRDGGCFRAGCGGEYCDLRGRKKKTGDWRKLHNEQLRYLCCLLFRKYYWDEIWMRFAVCVTVRAKKCVQNIDGKT
jgi:hypothetical protein